MTDKLITPSGIPHFIGDLATLDTDVMLLTADAGQFRASGSDVHTTFQGLSAFYSAPEAEDLFATTLPVRKKSDAFADDLEKVATALSDYSAEVQPLVQKLDALKADATTLVNSVQGDDDWRKDQDKVDHNNDLWHDVNHTVAAFEAAERTAYNKIMALIGGTPLTTDDGSHGKNMYGYKADDLDHAPETPWGAPAEREYEGWRWLTHQGKQLWDGVWTDGVVATFKGVGTLFGTEGWDAAGESWKNLAKIATATALTQVTYGAWWMTPDDQLPSWLRESRTAYKQYVKGFVAWDEWKTNPARAAGTAGFNILTVLGTDGAGSAASGSAKAAAATRALSTAGKVGRAIDPITYVAKAGKYGFVKVGDTFTTLKNLHTGATGDLLKEAEALRSPRIPDNAIPYVDETTGKTVYLTDEGHILNADGSLRQHANQAHLEPPARPRIPATDPNGRQLVGVSGHAPKATAHAGDVAASGPVNHEPPVSRSHIGSSDGGGSHDGLDSGGHTSGSADGHHGSLVGEHGDVPRGGQGGHSDGPGTPGDGSPDGHDSASDESGRLTEGERTSVAPTGPMRPDQEGEVITGLERAKMQAQDQQRLLVQLRKGDYGAGVADYIARGTFAEVPGYGDLLSQCKQKGMLPAVHQAMEFGSELQARGVDDLAFEYKSKTHGLDLDVLVKSGDEIKYGCQLKDVQLEHSIGSAAHKIATKQLAGAITGPKVAILDIHDTRAALTESTIKDVEHYAKKVGATFELRFRDGSVTIPPDGQIYP